MAIRLNKNADNIKVIVEIDDALDKSAADFDANFIEYTKTLNENLLTFLPGRQPTRFVMVRHLPLEAHEKVMEKQISVGSDMKPKVQLSYIIEEVRCALVGIENPAGCEYPIEFKKESDGFASKDLMAFLHEAGIINPLFNARQNAITAKVDKKN